MLELVNVRTGYGDIEVLHGINLTVEPGEIVTMIGANGAGKSTLIKAISGVLRISSGAIRFEGERVDGLSIEAIVGRGIVQIPEGRRLFGSLTVRENLELGAYLRRRGTRSLAERMDRVFQLFPRLKERLKQQAGTLSGGEQQMLAIGRALMAEPRLLLLDEPSMGLAPVVVRDIFATLRELNRQGLAMLLVEQDARLALRVAKKGLVIERGSVVLEDSAHALVENPQVRAIYFGRRNGEFGGGARKP
ncbi:MAG: ABC transporter ATP-binding protein [Thermoleophilia bacterium]|nr:ABC transporter ATP-binding protein [Thermoleophilia bacterium]